MKCFVWIYKCKNLTGVFDNLECLMLVLLKLLYIIEAKTSHGAQNTCTVYQVLENQFIKSSVHSSPWQSESSDIVFRSVRWGFQSIAIPMKTCLTTSIVEDQNHSSEPVCLIPPQAAQHSRRTNYPTAYGTHVDKFLLYVTLYESNLCALQKAFCKFCLGVTTFVGRVNPPRYDERKEVMLPRGHKEIIIRILNREILNWLRSETESEAAGGKLVLVPQIYIKLVLKLKLWKPRIHLILLSFEC